MTLLAPACRIDQLDLEAALASDSQTLELTRAPEAAPPGVRARLSLSEFAVARFTELQLRVALQTGQSLQGQGLSAEWVEGAEGVGESVSFTGPLWNELALSATASAVACAEAPCRVVLELAPRGSWQSDVSYPVRCRADATLLLERSERLPILADFELQLELIP
jgi:hypothetical protein